jgi:hypothetical protein
MESTELVNILLAGIPRSRSISFYPVLEVSSRRCPAAEEVPEVVARDAVHKVGILP